MSITKDHYFKKLLRNFLEIDESIEAIIISDEQGFVISGEKRKNIDMELVSVLTGLINPVLETIRNEFAFKKLGTASFDTEKNRLLFISIDENLILSIILSTFALIDKISPYAYFLAEKIDQILNMKEGELIQISIPNFEIGLETSNEPTRIEEQIYQMKLDSGTSYQFKFIIIGDHKVGKTSIVRRFAEGKFSHDYRATIGLNILSHSIEFYGNQINISLWDVGAQDYFKRLRKTYYLGVQAAFIAFDLTNRQSYDDIKKWYKELEDFIGDKEIRVVIVGNKSDLKNQRVVKYQEGVQIVKELSDKQTFMLSYIETSALTGENVEDAFKLIAYNYIVKSKKENEEILKEKLMSKINSVLSKKDKLTLSFITETAFWSPGLQIITEVNKLSGSQKLEDRGDTKLYEYSNGLVIKNFLYDTVDLSDSDGVFVIFDARWKGRIELVWRDVVIKIINSLSENKVALVGIRVSEKSDWSKIMEELNVYEYLEQKAISLLFFKITSEFRFKIYEQIELMLNILISLE